MTNLDTLLKIAREATPGPWECINGYGEKTDFTERKFHVTAIDSGLDTVMCGFDYEIEGSKQNFKYITTFNPRLLEKMLAEIKAGRCLDAMRCNMSTDVEEAIAQKAYDQAREALDAELESV